MTQNGGSSKPKRSQINLRVSLEPEHDRKHHFGSIHLKTPKGMDQYINNLEVKSEDSISDNDDYVKLNMLTPRSTGRLGIAS